MKSKENPHRTEEQTTTRYNVGSSASRTCFWTTTFWWPSEQTKLFGNVTRMVCVTTRTSEHFKACCSNKTGYLPILLFLFRSTWRRRSLTDGLVGAQNF